MFSGLILGLGLGLLGLIIFSLHEELKRKIEEPVFKLILDGKEKVGFPAAALTSTRFAPS